MRKHVQRRPAFIMMDALVGMGMLLAGVAIGIGLLLQFRLTERRQQREWAALAELRNATERLRASEWNELTLGERWLEVSSESSDLLPSPELKLTTTESKEDGIEGKRLELQLTWIESQQRIGNPRTLTSWRFRQP